MGLGGSKETHFTLLKKAEGVLSNRSASQAQLNVALDQCRLAVEECPTYPFTYMILAKLLMRLGRYREAADATVECIELSPSEMYSMYFMLADCLEACDEYEAAAAAIAKVPKSRRAELREVHERRKKYLVQSVPPSDGAAKVNHNASPLVPPGHRPALRLGGGGGGGSNDVELKSQDSYGDGMSVDHLLSTDSSSSLSGSVTVKSLQHGPVTLREEPHALPPLGPVQPEDDRDEHDRAVDEWYDTRESEFGAALKRDTNYRKFLMGERNQYLQRPKDRTRMKRIGEHREKFTRLSAAQFK